jgi:cytidylate kinase
MENRAPFTPWPRLINCQGIMKQILIIDREFGAGGGDIAKLLAARLNWKLFDEALSEEIARLARIPVKVCHRHEERTDPWLQRLINIIWRGTFDRNLPSPDLAILDTDRLVTLVKQVIEQAVKDQPCIIVGRGAPYFLRHRTDTFPVFLYASRELKFQRVLKRVGDAREAVELLDNMDEDRKKFVKHYHGVNWPDRQLFQAMFNTGIGDENTAEAILQLLNAANRNEKGDKA